MPKHEQLIDGGYAAWWDAEKAFPSSGIFHHFYKAWELYFKN